ncbi:MAG: diguanylate cyclase [Ktedonobacteraceae bacterium]
MIKKYFDTSYVPWRLMMRLSLVSFVMAVYFVTRPVNLQLFNVIIHILAIVYPLTLSWLCFRGSGTFLWPSHSAHPALPTYRRFSPAFLGMAMLCFTLAEVFWVQRTIAQPITSAAEAYAGVEHYIFLGMYPFLICAVLFLPLQNLPLLPRLRLLLDSLIIIVAITTCFYYFIVAPIFVTGVGTVGEKIVASIFPTADLVLLFCLLLVALRFGGATLRPALIFLSVTVLCLFVNDVSDLYGVLSKSYNELSLSNVTLFLAAIMIVGAAQTVRRMLDKDGSVRAISPNEVERVGLLSPTGCWKAVLPSLLVLIFGLLVFGIWLTGGAQHFHGQILIVYVGSFVVLLLMVLRQFLAMHEINKLQRSVRAKNLSLSMLNVKLEQLAISDSLTELLNHRVLMVKLDEALEHARTTSSTCAVICMDIDHFKTINDGSGHLVGDVVLRNFGMVVKLVLRPTDWVGRWGGDEFMAIVPDVDPFEAYQVAERIRKMIDQRVLAGNGELRVTCSLGVATYPDDASERETLIMLADAAMYEAKRLGRNQTRTAHEPSVQGFGIAVEAPRTLEERDVLGIVEALIALQEIRDHLTSEHERRVSALARKLALKMGLSEEAAYVVSLGGLLHDLGKVTLPDKLLLKKGRLTEQEFSAVRTHPVAGAEVLSTVPTLHEVAAIVRSHHEWMDGSGYPDTLAGEAIPLGARIVAVADAYDVITHHRPYQDAHTTVEALHALLKSSESQFDPYVVAALVRVLAEGPIRQVGDAA